ncbi:Protein eyes shut, partial [Eufriesea mexicana]
RMVIEKFMKNKTLILTTFFLLTIDISRGLNCSGDPCMYGICIEDSNSTYSCYCIDGYTGINCEINWNDCWSNPCLNGGTCNDAVAAYNCTCTEGFVGVNCEQRYSECSNQPCLNNGTCLDYDGITCQCPDGYSGDYCEIDASVCNDTICKNRGECVEGPGLSFFCRCSEGWTGRLCDEDVDECIIIPASYTCACLFGYTGKDCDKTIVPCEENPCKNDAICLFEDERPICYCVPDYHGALCELKYDDCESKFANCQNGGTCIDGINSFTCACPTYYSGPFCNVHDLPSTTSSTLEAILEADDNKKTTAFTLFASKSSTVPEIDTSSSSITASTLQSSVSFSPSYTKWYPFIETTSSTANKDDVNYFSSISSSTSTSSSIIGSSATGSIQFVTDISPPYSITSKEMSQTETILEPRTFPSVSSEAYSVTSTIRTEAEYLTQKSIYNETMTDIIHQENNARTFAPINNTSSSEADNTVAYTSST